MLILKNPHSVISALEDRPVDVMEIRLPGAGTPGEAWEKVISLARRHQIRVSDRRSGAPRGGAIRQRGAGGEETGNGSGGRVGAAEALVRERQPVAMEVLFRDAALSRAGGKGLWLALDNLQDPHNVGAIFRSAAFFGARGILMTQERSAPLTSTVYDVASGGLEHVPFAIQVNLQRGLEKAKEAGLWILGATEHAKDDLASISRDRPWLLVIGNEEKGMRRLTEEACDVLCRITPRGEVRSLNASVAASICIAALTSGP